ncbi:MAG: T9SS type B sorting domain-containing protein, partial [Sphingobacteriales bacterium]
KTYTAGASNGLLLKYTKDLGLVWVKSLFSDRDSRISEIATDKNLNIYVILSGTITGSYLQFDGITLDALKIHLISLNSDGSTKFIKSFIGKNPINQSHPLANQCNDVYYLCFGSNSNDVQLDNIYYPATQDYSFWQFLAKLKTDSLNFIAQPVCNGISLINKSDTILYKSFIWTLPDSSTQNTKDAFLKPTANDSELVFLEGITKDGCSDKKAIKIRTKFISNPEANFDVESTIGCQWVGMQFHNLSKTDTISAAGESFLWDFGDNTFSAQKDPVHVFTKPGLFKIKLIYCNGFASDTFILVKQITIIAAPKPGFTVNEKAGCAPFTANITNQSIGQVETYFYTSTDGQTSNQPAPTFIYTKPGKYFITQMLKGPTECITKDSVEITVRAGYSQATLPEILTATVTDSQFVKVSWKKNDVTAKYKLVRQSVSNTKTFEFTGNDTFFVDKDADVNKAFYSYTLYGTDSCSNVKSTNIATTILLENQNQTTDYNLLRWNTYEKWQNGVQEFQLQYRLDSDFIPLTILPGNMTNYKDAGIYNNAAKQICYKIIAAENAGNKQTSQSNTVCMNFLPVIFVPNAFSPNNDGINDEFNFSAIGIENYELTIYNRWGEKVFTSTEKEKSWNGKFKNAAAPEGIYLYKLTAKPYTGKNFYQSGNLQLLR